MRVDGEELKLWQAVLEYIDAQPIGMEGLPEIDDYYKDVHDRIVTVSETTLLTKILLFLNALYIFLPAAYYVLALLVIVVTVIIIWRRRRRVSDRAVV